ncbi:MAG TPA: S-adenosylmethionine:tRNA ribosyltransferase-isomerase [Bacteroidales bacterium]|jgi:S-adenosylmethionine:tRNA ribosyltransferase-isomerase|nr:S-adenosylmethionine:tRNA ribosyltransferase-isomerase [Bacteroidales bacterium]HQJ81901.1 S-adenosylmethionine:tRNA ribosyltransferase-isomerase [Bacteroidales bacterium]
MKKLFEKIKIDDFDYDLPAERIALYPAGERDESKLLVYSGEETKEDIFRNISGYLPGDALLVFNNTRVIKARLLFTKRSGSRIEILLLEPLNPSDYGRTFASQSPVEWKCMIGNLKKWKEESISLPFELNHRLYTLTATKRGPADEAWGVKFSWEPADISFSEVLLAAGHIPLPPYIDREDEQSDAIRYQTIYGRISGSVASPTAGLHFTDRVIKELLNRGMQQTEITLHVGAGTFQPVRAKNIAEHEMHCERYTVTRSTLELLLSKPGKAIAVGTTAVRTLESLYWLGRKILTGPSGGREPFYTAQWEAYGVNREKETGTEDSLGALLRIMDENGTDMIEASTSLMIIPGYRFRMTDGMITNFHLPRSSLLLLVSAWTGSKWKEIYDFALTHDFRFLSYGDSSLLIK